MKVDSLPTWFLEESFLPTVALTWIIVIVAQASLSFPLEHLGKRPHGRNVWTWWWNSLIGINNFSACTGYDSVQGALAPGIRLQCHGALILLWWTLWCQIMSDHDNTDMDMDVDIDMDICETCVEKLWNGLLALATYVLACIVSSCFMDGVSMPGGPRVFKIARTPQWEDVTTPAILTDMDDSNNEWKCLVAGASYEHTTAGSDTKHDALLTGEAAGRQIWVNMDKSTAANDLSHKNSSKEGHMNNMVGKIFRAVSGISNNQDDKKDENSSKMETRIREMAQGGRTEFGFNAAKNPNSCDMIFRKQQIQKWVSQGGELPTTSIPKTVAEASKKAAHFYSMLQCEDGHFAADYGGPHFLLPGLISAWYLMGKPKQMIDGPAKTQMQKYILCHQQSDGGWGTHLESPSTMFGSTLMYVALRLLGTDADHPACVKGRDFLRGQGGALYTSSWSKFYLCLLGLMDWRGHNSVPPEMWLLPNWFPLHPGRMWCHARMVYLPMGYLYGTRFVYPDAETDPLIQALREELYCESYDSIDWIPTRHWVASMDNYSPVPLIMKVLQNILALYENVAIFQPFKNWIRAKGIAFSMEYIKAEDLQTNFIDIGPVNKVLNMISHFHALNGNLEDPILVKHMMRIPDYLWVAEDGMKMQGYNGSQCWDTSFCAQALFEAGVLDDFPETSKMIWTYLERTQILSTEVSQASPAFQYESNKYRQMFYRHISQGGWPFSTSAHGWPISDCTGEGLKATLCLLKSECVQKGLEDASLKKISDERLYQAANILLSYQNEDGGWATYENNRGWGWYEQLNPSEVFGDIMIDYSYVECSMASLTALVDFREHYPNHRVKDIQHAIDKGRDFLKSIQRDDGSWYGSWACCFTYGIWFGVEGLIKCGESFDSPCIVDACKFLLKHQRPNGGWGEDFTSCYDKDYAKEGMKTYGDDGAGVVNTAWALLSLSMAKCEDVDAVRRGVQYLMKRQLSSGDWPQEGISGVFNRSVGITYTAYRNVFPMWALGRCHETYGDKLDTDLES